jgi:hypothetical protein
MKSIAPGGIFLEPSMPLNGANSKPYAIFNILLSKVAFFLLD